MKLTTIADLLDILAIKQNRSREANYSVSIGKSECNNCTEFDTLSRDCRIVLKTHLSIIDQYILLEILRYLWTRDNKVFRKCGGGDYERLRNYAEENHYRMTYDNVLPKIRKPNVRWADEVTYHAQTIYTIDDIYKIIHHLILWGE